MAAVGVKLTGHRGSVTSAPKGKSLEFSRGLSADLVDSEGFVILSHEISGILIVYEYSTGSLHGTV